MLCPVQAGVSLGAGNVDRAIGAWARDQHNEAQDQSRDLSAVRRL